MALVIESVSCAKIDIVKEYGVGEDLTISLYGWVDDRLAIICQMEDKIMNGDKLERFKKLINAACIMRQGWGVSEFTLVAEGYCSTNPEETRDESLDVMFVKNPNVFECLTFTHVDGIEFSIMTRPYKVTWPRKVEFSELMYYPGQSVLRSSDAPIPVMLSKVLDMSTNEIPDEEVDAYYEELIYGLRYEGFLAQAL